MSDVVERYVLLGLRLGRHVEGFVDSYYGPPELAARVEAEPPAAPEELVGEARALAALLDEDALEDAQRSRWLQAQLAGLETVARRLAGERVGYVEEVERCYGVRPERVPEEELEAAHRALAEALPGPGSLSERYRAWRDASALDRELVLPALEALADELRTRTRERFGLPDGEVVDLELVTDEPWAGFNYYLGNLRSRVVLNLDLPVRAPRMPVYAAHEIYPGHHTEHAVKEAALVRGRGYLEESIFLVGTPQALVSEGIASVALDALGEEAEEACATILDGLGCGYDPGVARAIRSAEETLGGVYDAVALMLHEDGASLEAARAYGERWTLLPRQEVEKLIEFVTHPTWRAYAITYSAGERLVARFAGADPARFRRLLSEQLTTADLLASQQ